MGVEDAGWEPEVRNYINLPPQPPPPSPGSAEACFYSSLFTVFQTVITAFLSLFFFVSKPTLKQLTVH